MVSSILSQQWLWGVILGASLAYFSQWLQYSRQHKNKQKIASMQVATFLRCWLFNCSNAVLDYQNWESTNGQMGRKLNKIPALNIEQSLDQIVCLNTAEAKAVFEWIHETKDAERNYAFMLDVDGEIATDQLLIDCGALFNSGLNIYNTLALIVGWKASPVSEDSIQRMASLGDRAHRTAERGEES